MKGTPLFKIIPEGMDDDEQDNFAALGYENDEEMDEQNY